MQTDGASPNTARWLSVLSKQIWRRPTGTVLCRPRLDLINVETNRLSSPQPVGPTHPGVKWVHACLTFDSSGHGHEPCQLRSNVYERTRSKPTRIKFSLFIIKHVLFLIQRAKGSDVSCKERILSWPVSFNNVQPHFGWLWGSF